MLFKTTEQHEALRAQIRAFAEAEVKPEDFLMDKENQFPDEAVRKLGEMGWMGIPYPKEYGGAGLDAMSYAIAVEELSRVDGGTETTAVDKGDYWLLNGGKIFITNILGKPPQERGRLLQPAQKARSRHRCAQAHPAEGGECRRPGQRPG